MKISKETPLLLTVKEIPWLTLGGGLLFFLVGLSTYFNLLKWEQKPPEIFIYGIIIGGLILILVSRFNSYIFSKSNNRINFISWGILGFHNNQYYLNQVSTVVQQEQPYIHHGGGKPHRLVLLFKDSKKVPFTVSYSTGDYLIDTGKRIANFLNVSFIESQPSEVITPENTEKNII